MSKYFYSAILTFMSVICLQAQDKIGLHTDTPDAPVHIWSSGQVYTPNGLLLLGDRSEAHLEMDFDLLQSKYGALGVRILKLNPLGGFVGVNTPSPKSTFHIWNPGQVSNPSGSLLIGNPAEAHLKADFDFMQSSFGANSTLPFRLQPEGGNINMSNGKFYINDNKRIGINTTDPLTDLHIVGSGNDVSLMITPLGDNNENAEIILSEDNDNTYGMSLKYLGAENDLRVFGTAEGESFGPHMIISRQLGEITIPNSLSIGPHGSVPAGFRLAVDGRIRTEGLKCDLSGNWADFVFEEDYELMSIEKVADFISKNHHLPGFKSAEKFKEEGIDLEETLTAQQQKIEELMLYIIDLKAEIEALKRKNKQ